MITAFFSASYLPLNWWSFPAASPFASSSAWIPNKILEQIHLMTRDVIIIRFPDPILIDIWEEFYLFLLCLTRNRVCVSSYIDIKRSSSSRWTSFLLGIAPIMGFSTTWPDSITSLAAMLWTHLLRCTIPVVLILKLSCSFFHYSPCILYCMTTNLYTDHRSNLYAGLPSYLLILFSALSAFAVVG